MNMRKVRVVATAMAAMLLLSACPMTQQRDYEGAQVRDPDEVVIFTNVDEHPNIVRVCLDGIAFATTTRDFTAIFRVPEWDSFCQTQDFINRNGGRSGDSGTDPSVAP